MRESPDEGKKKIVREDNASGDAEKVEVVNPDLHNSEDERPGVGYEILSIGTDQ